MTEMVTCFFVVSAPSLPESSSTYVREAHRKDECAAHERGRSEGVVFDLLRGRARIDIDHPPRTAEGVRHNAEDLRAAHDVRRPRHVDGREPRGAGHPEALEQASRRRAIVDGVVGIHEARDDVPRGVKLGGRPAGSRRGKAIAERGRR